jgi:uncharacterized protein (TIGR02145 family)
MKSTSGWNAPNTAATNSSGFSGLPGGKRFDGDDYVDIGIIGYWWSSSEINTDFVWTRALIYSDGLAYREEDDKSDGFPCRCIRD